MERIQLPAGSEGLEKVNGNLRGDAVSAMPRQAGTPKEALEDSVMLPLNPGIFKIDTFPKVRTWSPLLFKVKKGSARRPWCSAGRIPGKCRLTQMGLLQDSAAWPVSDSNTWEDNPGFWGDEIIPSVDELCVEFQENLELSLEIEVN